MKSDILQKCRDIVNQRMDHLREAMEEAQQSANEYGPPKDRYDSYRTQLLRKKDMYGQQLAVAAEQSKTLEKIDPGKIHKKAGFGSLVITESQKIFISVGLGKIEINGDIIYAVSPVVPVAKVLEGQKEGGICDLNGKKIKVIKIS